jgi:hypothetical protein
LGPERRVRFVESCSRTTGWSEILFAKSLSTTLLWLRSCGAAGEAPGLGCRPEAHRNARNEALNSSSALVGWVER